MARSLFMFSLLLALLCGFSPSAINPKDYGVTLNGTTDDTASWQAAVNAAIAQGLPLASPCGTSIVSAPIVISSPMTFSGGGIDCTSLKAVAGQAAISVTAVRSVALQGFTVLCNATGQTGIVVNPPSTWNQQSVISNVSVSGCDVGIDFVAAASFKVDFVNIWTHTGAVGIRVQNTFAGDTGDSQIVSSTFSSDAPNSAAIVQYDSGGLKIIGNKFFGWAWGYMLQLAAATNTGVLLIEGNSFENQAAAGIGFQRQGTSGGFSTIAIVGNEIAANQYCVVNYAGAGWLSAIAVVGNRLACQTPLALTGVTDVVSTGNF